MIEDDNNKYVFDTDAEKYFSFEELGSTSSVTTITGPESGFSEKELDSIKKNNIEIRTKKMIDNGLVEEINKISNPSKTVLQAIGMNLSDNLEENINIKTKRLAKKQITWFKKEPKLHMIETDDEDLVYNSMMEIING